MPLALGGTLSRGCDEAAVAGITVVFVPSFKFVAAWFVPWFVGFPEICRFPDPQEGEPKNCGGKVSAPSTAKSGAYLPNSVGEMNMMNPMTAYTPTRFNPGASPPVDPSSDVEMVEVLLIA